MLPARGGIQVSLEDTGCASSGVSCRPPTQVKILRRPKPVEPTGPNVATIASTSTTATGQIIVDNNVNNPLAGDNHLVYDKTKLTSKATLTDAGEDRVANGGLLASAAGPTSMNVLQKQQVPNKYTTNGIQPGRSWASMAAGAVKHKSSSQQQQSTHNGSIVSPSSTVANSALDNGSSSCCSSSSQQHGHATTGTSGTMGGANFNNSSNSTVIKKPLKTYQERADEYARARLRILGSAFPEEINDSLTSIINNDNVDRILNLNLNADSNCNSNSVVPARLTNLVVNNSDNNVSAEGENLGSTRRPKSSS